MGYNIGYRECMKYCYAFELLAGEKMNYKASEDSHL